MTLVSIVPVYALDHGPLAFSLSNIPTSMYVN
jgi:hypothetical protein